MRAEHARNATKGLRGGPDDPVVIFTGDILPGHDIAGQLDVPRKADAAVTLHRVEAADPARFGCVPPEPAGRVTAFLEKTANPVTNLVNAGCHVFRRVSLTRFRRAAWYRWSVRRSLDGGQRALR